MKIHKRNAKEGPLYHMRMMKAKICGVKVFSGRRHVRRSIASVSRQRRPSLLTYDLRPFPNDNILHV